MKRTSLLLGATLLAAICAMHPQPAHAATVTADCAPDPSSHAFPEIRSIRVFGRTGSAHC
jgi:hypothetical protein